MEINNTQSISPIGAATATQSATTGKGEVGKDEFLKLLTAQLENQDPLEPLKNHEFVAQLAQFSALEQQVVTNATLTELQSAQMSMANTQMTSMIGKEIVAGGDTVRIEQGQAPDIGLVLEKSAASVNIIVKDENGQSVATIERPNLPGGYQAIQWNGMGANNQKLLDGNYTISVEALDAQGELVPVTTQTSGVVTGLDFTQGYARLVVGDAVVAPADVISVAGQPVTLPDLTNSADPTPEDTVPDEPPLSTDEGQPGPRLGARRYPASSSFR